MPSPYRESDNTPPAPLAELAWRRRVARSARWAGMLVLGDLALLVASYGLPARFGLARAVVWSVLGGGAAIATWIVTARRPGGRVGLRGWLLRISAPAFLAVLGLLLLGVHLEIASYVGGALLVMAVLVHFNGFQRPQSGRQRFWLIFVVGTTFVFSLLLDLLPSSSPLGLGFCLAVLFLAAVGFEILRHQLLPVDDRFWFDNHMEWPGEWVSLLVYRDWQAEVLRVDETLGRFASEDKAREWLENNGYVPAERAIEERLVSEAPPDVLKVRARKKVRAASASRQARVRVAPEASDSSANETADGAADALDDSSPLHEPEPSRVVVVHDPHDPDA